VQAVVIPRKRMLDLTTFNGGDYEDLVHGAENDDQRNRERYSEVGDVFIWKMSRFAFDVQTLGDILGKAQKHPVLVIDVRENGGGSVESLQNLIGRLFDHDVKIADLVTRKPEKPSIAKHWGKTYTGKVIVLVDSESASASEILARVIQLEHRGTVIGDQTAGAVMESRSIGSSIGADSKILYGFSITHANLIMTDGKSLEGTGVDPDERLIPAADDLTTGKDPVLARAVVLGGGKMTPAEAGKLFPYEWPKLL
jgi:C-terminal processing protease CtpA/Prc